MEHGASLVKIDIQRCFACAIGQLCRSLRPHTALRDKAERKLIQNCNSMDSG